jgi:hypothetical protein
MASESGTGVSLFSVIFFHYLLVRILLGHSKASGTFSTFHLTLQCDAITRRHGTAWLASDWIEIADHQYQYQYQFLRYYVCNICISTSPSTSARSAQPSTTLHIPSRPKSERHPPPRPKTPRLPPQQLQPKPRPDLQLWATHATCLTNPKEHGSLSTSHPESTELLHLLVCFNSSVNHARRVADAGDGRGHRSLFIGT